MAVIMDNPRTAPHPNAAHQARWLLEFMQAEFGSPKGSPLVEVRQRMAELMGLSFGAIRKDGKLPGHLRPTASEIRGLHTTLRRILKQLKDGEPWTLAMEAARTVRVEGFRVISETGFTPTHETKQALVAAMNALLAVQDRLRVCPNDRNFFLRKGRQRFCSRRCQDTAAKRRYRGREMNSE
jgi:hypothetical protein